MHFFPFCFHLEIFKFKNFFFFLGSENRRQYSLEEEDDLIQFAIQQSLMEVGSERDEVDIWEALKAQKPSPPTSPNLNSEETRQLQR